MWTCNNYAELGQLFFQGGGGGDLVHFREGEDCLLVQF